MCSVESLKLRHLHEQHKTLIEEKIRHISGLNLEFIIDSGRGLEMRIDQYY